MGVPLLDLDGLTNGGMHTYIQRHLTMNPPHQRIMLISEKPLEMYLTEKRIIHQSTPFPLTLLLFDQMRILKIKMLMFWVPIR